MANTAAILGGSVGGLAAGIALARRGWAVTVVERDGPPEVASGDEAFVEWERPQVPQWRQPHGFSSRARNLLLMHIPEVVDRLVDDGCDEVNLFKLMAPPEMHRPEDDRFGMLWSRRPGFELALRREAEAQDGLDIRSPASVAGLIVDSDATTPRVRGLELADRTELHADVVIDAGGRRSPVNQWLEELGITIPSERQDCAGLYYSRYYRLHPDAELHPIMLIGQRTALEQAAIIGFTGDHGTFGILAAPNAGVEEYKVLRHDWAWDAFLGAIPRWAPWVDPANATPLTSVAFMGGHQNILRHHVVDGRALVHGLLPVGDSLCTTNPQYGWGASMALTYAFAAVDAAATHVDDPETMALAYHDVVREEAGTVYSESAAMDRIQLREWSGEPTPPDEIDVVERQMLLRGMAAGSTHHPALGRAMLVRTGLLDGWNDVLDDPEVVEQARRSLEIVSGKPISGPSTESLMEAVEAARP